MSGHRFQIGQNVKLLSLFPRTGTKPYSIVQLMPYDGSCFEYRIKSSAEQFFRIAKEHDLSGDELGIGRGT